MDLERIILVRRPTRLQGLTRRYNTSSQAKFYVESRKQSFDDYVFEDETYRQSRESVLHQIPRSIKVHEVDRAYLPNYVFGPGDLVLTLGQDGLVVNVAKYLSGQPILAVNPDPARFDGVLLPFQVDDVAHTLGEYVAGRLKIRNITMAQVGLNDGQSLLAFNDIFIGPQSHTSARYSIQYRDSREFHSSSGLIISTPAGATGWLSSLYNMTAGIAGFAGLSLSQDYADSDEAQDAGIQTLGDYLHPPSLQWEDRRLVFMVREPFRSQVSQAGIVAGFIEEGESLVLESQMPESGVIFSDGMEWDFLQFNSGATARIEVSRKTTNLLVSE